MNKKRAALLGFVSAMVVAGGILVTALLHQAVVTSEEGSIDSDRPVQSRSVMTVSGQLWLSGFVYIIPGILGIIAAIVQNKCVYVITCIVAMISLLLAVTVIIVGGLTLIIFIFAHSSISEICVDTHKGCVCRFEEEKGKEVTLFKTCAYFETFTAICIALLVFIILTWLGILFEFILACYFSCRSTSTTGVVIIPAQQPMLYQGQEMGPPSYNYGNPIPNKV